MHKPLILVTGAAGRTGSALVGELRDRFYPVRAILRQRDARSDRLAARGADVVIADIRDPDQMLNAMNGVQRAYVLPADQPACPDDPDSIHARSRTGTAQIRGRHDAVARQPVASGPVDARHVGHQAATADATRRVRDHPQPRILRRQSFPDRPRHGRAARSLPELRW